MPCAFYLHNVVFDYQLRDFSAKKAVKVLKIEKQWAHKHTREQCYIFSLGERGKVEVNGGNGQFTLPGKVVPGACVALDYVHRASEELLREFCTASGESYRPDELRLQLRRLEAESPRGRKVYTDGTGPEEMEVFFLGVKGDFESLSFFLSEAEKLFGGVITINNDNNGRVTEMSKRGNIVRVMLGAFMDDVKAQNWKGARQELLNAAKLCEESASLLEGL